MSIDNQLTLSWQASDADEADRLLFMVQYSPDSGQHWRTLLTSFPNLTDSDTVTLDLTELGGLPASTTGALIRVAASDGYNTTLATSQPFSVANRAPEPRIVAPGAAPLPAGQPILLRGSATDAEEGGLPDEALSWAIDGEGIGSGAQRSIDGLAPGSYTVSLSAADAAGAERAVTTTLTVAPLVIPAAAAPTLDGSCDDPTYATAPQLALRAYADRSSASVRLLRSSDALWACFVGMQRTGELSAGTLASVRIDSDNSRDSQPQAGDYGFAIGEDGTLTIYEGNGTGYVAQGQTGLRGQVSANDTSWMAELRIEAGLIGGWERVIGLSVEQVAVTAPLDNHAWPHLATADNPGSWAAAALGAIPQLSAISPASAAAGATDLQITLSGAGFASGATVVWDGAPLQTTVLSNTQVQAIIPESELDEAGMRSVTVVNPGLEAAPSNRQLFSILNPAPVISELTLTDNLLTVRGRNFAADATIIWNGIARSPTGVGSARLAARLANATQLTIELDHADLLAPENLEVTVLNPGPGGGLSNVATLSDGERLSKVYLPLLRR